MILIHLECTFYRHNTFQYHQPPFLSLMFQRDEQLEVWVWAFFTGFYQVSLTFVLLVLFVFGLP